MRVKGLVTLEDSASDVADKSGDAGEACGRHLVQRVGRRWSVEPTGLIGPDRLVLISLRDQVDLETIADQLTPEEPSDDH